MGEINLAETLVAKRHEKGVTQVELAQHIGVTVASVSKWETGLNYPDITLLPLLATYYNISVDELISYRPQMEKKDISRLYKRLSGKFTTATLKEALDECRSVIKKYYSCFPLICQMALLLLNHHMLAEREEERQNILSEAIQLCERVCNESNDISLTKEAIYLQALCYIAMDKPESVLALLGDSVSSFKMDDLLTVQAHSMIGNVEKAKKNAQIVMYQHLMCLLEITKSYLKLCVTDEMERAQEIIKRVQPIMDTFNIEQINPTLTFSLYAVKSQFYCTKGQTDKALSILERGVDVCMREIYLNSPHGDAFFDYLNQWLYEQGITEALQNKTAFIGGILSDLLHCPAFSVIENEPRFIRTVQRIKDYVNK